MFKLNPAVLVLVSALTLPACKGDDPGTSDGASSSSGDEGTTTDGNSTSGTPTTSGNATTTGMEESGGSTTTGDTPTTTGVEPTTTTDNSGNFLTTQTSGSEGGGPQPNGSPCAGDDECESMNCVNLLGGMVTFCGECNEDQDCVDAGMGTACSIGFDMTAACTDGPPGSTCMSDEACMGDQFCETALDTPILPATCGECAESGDCDMGQICTPALDLMTATGMKSCVEPGSVENNSLCPAGAEGPMACMSGHCTEASLLGFVMVNICGECTGDMDCMNGETCVPAEATQMGFTGSTCQ